jgi:hypothetical protein
MAAPPGVNVNFIALGKLKLNLTKMGMQAFNRKFPAALGPCLATTLRDAITPGCTHRK